LRTSRWRLTEWYGEGGELVARELYDHEQDPLENANVAERAENRQIVQQLSGKLAELLAISDRAGIGNR
jgi:hypothetical protein